LLERRRGGTRHIEVRWFGALLHSHFFLEVSVYRNSTRRSRRTRGARGLVATSTALALCVLAGCGGGDSSSEGDSASGGETDDAAVTEAQARLDPYLENSEEIEVDTPLTRKPDEGKSVYFIRYNLPVAAEFDAPLAEATEALGWESQVIAIDATDPQSTSNAMLRSVSEGADYIAVQSGNIAVMGPGLEAAKGAGIPVFLQGGIGEPEGEANGIYGHTQNSATRLGNLGLVDQMIIESGGTGTGLVVNAPDFPILAPVDAAADDYIAEHCSGCSLEHLSISAADLGGDVASGTVAAIRQNPDIKYVLGAFDQLVNGLPQALAAAGLNDVQVYISNPSRPFVEQIAQGDYQAGMILSNNNRVWLLVDQMARHSVGMDTDQESHGDMRQRLWTTETVPDGETSWDPENYQDQYKELWQVS
jgi:ABC-type sugar transport system substrate-binding protein